MDRKSIQKNSFKILAPVTYIQFIYFIVLFFVAALVVEACATDGTIVYSIPNDDKQLASSTPVFSYYHLYRDLSLLPKYAIATSTDEYATRYGEERYQEIQAWNDEKNKISQDNNTVSIYTFFMDCTRPSYVSALAALQKREKIFSNNELKEWITDRERSWGGCSSKGDSYESSATPADLLLLAKEKNTTISFYSKVVSYVTSFFKKKELSKSEVTLDGIYSSKR